MTEPAHLIHLNFKTSELGNKPEDILCLLSGDPARSFYIAHKYLKEVKELSTHRGLNIYLGKSHTGKLVLCATSGMGGSSISIVATELILAGIKKIIRIGTCGSWKTHIKNGDILVAKGSVSHCGAANDIAPAEYPALSDPELSVSLFHNFKKNGLSVYLALGMTTDTFYEGQGRLSFSGRHIRPEFKNIIENMSSLNVEFAEMENACLFKIAMVHGIKAAAICIVAAERAVVNETELVNYSKLQESLDKIIELILANE